MENTHARLRCSSATHQVFIRCQMFQEEKLFIYLSFCVFRDVANRGWRVNSSRDFRNYQRHTWKSAYQ
jgi:hypothetical protein